MANDERNKDERAANLVAQALKLVASGQAEVELLRPSEACYSR